MKRDVNMAFTYYLPDEQGEKVEYRTSNNAVVIIGANGAGKSKLGAWIEQQNFEAVHRIGAQRNLNFSENIPLKSYSQEEDLVFWGDDGETGHWKNTKGSRWDNGKAYTTTMLNDFDNVLAALIALTNKENSDFVQECKKAEHAGNDKPHTPVTSTDKLSHVWDDVFPQRRLEYSDAKFMAAFNKNDAEVKYSSTQMSDGERAVLYLTSQVLCIDFGSADDEIAKIDVQQGEGGLPKVFKMSSADQQYFKQYFNSLPPESRVRQCKSMMFKQLNKINEVDAGELQDYLNLIVDGMDKAQLDAMEKSPMGFALKIKAKIKHLLDDHCLITFRHWIETGRIICKPSYVLPQAIHPAVSTEMYSGTLYQAEEGDLTAPEKKLALNLTGVENIRWWHRNISQSGFCINGFINHYPDFIIRTNSGKIVMAETKGEQLKNEDSRAKLEIGKAWQHAAGSQYRYYMVFESGDNLPEGAVSTNDFMEILKAL